MRLDIEKSRGSVVLVRDGLPLVHFPSKSVSGRRLAFEADGRAYVAEKSTQDGVLVLSDATTGHPLAQRVSLGALSSDCDVEAVMDDGAIHVIRLDRLSVWKSRRIELRSGGVAVGAVGSDGLWKQRVWAEVPDAWPLPVSVFVVWLALRQFAAEDAAAAAV